MRKPRKLSGASVQRVEREGSLRRVSEGLELLAKEKGVGQGEMGTGDWKAPRQPDRRAASSARPRGSGCGLNPIA